MIREQGLVQKFSLEKQELNREWSAKLTQVEQQVKQRFQAQLDHLAENEIKN